MRLHDSLDAGDVVSEAMKLLPQLARADAWAFYLKAEKATRLELVRVVNANFGRVGPIIDIVGNETPLARAVIENKTVQADFEGEPNERVALICLPLIVGHRLIGAIQAMRAGASPFSPAEARLIEVMTGSIARALANAMDYHNATRQSLVDDLTRLYNVRYLYRMLENEIRRAGRYGWPLSVVFMDLDGFKQVNDAHGHCAGSHTLSEVAQVILMSVREVDFVSRYGGDEFVIMLPETSSHKAVEVAERVRANISNHSFDGGVGADIRLTASFGVASFPEHGSESEKLIELADAAMYQAKQRHKNTVNVAAS
ncbi:MAG: GGDEF domain-containing protein [Acidobacteriota bacterium]